MTQMFRLASRYMRYLGVLLAHKWFVCLAGWKARVPLWRLVIHDWSKFLPSQFFPYADHFYGDLRGRTGVSPYDYAWLRHVNANPHHWEYWVPRTHMRGPKNGRAEMRTMPMPEWAMREMVADWCAASRTYDGCWPTLGRWPWLERQFDMLKERMDPQTFTAVMALIMEVVGKWETRRYPFIRKARTFYPYGLSFTLVTPRTPGYVGGNWVITAQWVSGETVRQAICIPWFLSLRFYATPISPR